MYSVVVLVEVGDEPGKQTILKNGFKKLKLSYSDKATPKSPKTLSKILGTSKKNFKIFAQRLGNLTPADFLNFRYSVLSTCLTI